MSTTDYASLEVERVVLHPLVSGSFAIDEAVDKAYVDTSITSAVSALVNGASGAYDTLKEIETALSANAGSASGEILNKVADEKKERVAEDLVLDGKITAEATARGAAITSEATARTAAAAAENLLRVAAEGVLRSDLDAEVAARGLAESALSSSITSLQGDKFNKSGGSISGEVVLDSYLNFGAAWRVKASSDGSKVVFEFKRNGVWRTAVPFISKA